MNFDKSASADAQTKSSFDTLYSMTWNIEGLKRNVHNLKHFVDNYDPDFIFLAEPQIFQCDLDNVMEYFTGKYVYSLNSADKYDLGLPLNFFTTNHHFYKVFGRGISST